MGHSLAAGLLTGTVLALHTCRAPVVALSAALSGGLVVAVDGVSWFSQFRERGLAPSL